MKTRHWFGIIFASLLILSGCTKFSNRGVMENPAYIVRSANSLELEKVEVSDTATVLHLRAYYYGSWINIDKNGFLSDVQGNKYNLISSEGLEIGHEYNMVPNEEKEFSLIFPPIPSNLVTIDYSEGDYASAWRFLGIQLTDKPLNVNLPKGFKDIAIDKNAVLPPVEFKTGKARIEGQILNYASGMATEVSVMVANPFEYPPARITIPVDSNGVFSGEIDAISAHRATVGWQSGRYECFIAPGETTSLILNPAEKERKASRFADKRPSLGEPVYYGGFMASIAKEIANIDLSNKATQFSSMEEYLSYYKSFTGKTPEELRTYYLDEYKAKKAAIDTLDISPASKQILNCDIELAYAYDITNIPSLVDQVYIISNNLQTDREAVQKYYATRKHDIPEDFYDVLKDFSSINTPQIMYVRESANSSAYRWRMQNKQPVLSKALNTDEGILFDIMNIAGKLADIKDYKPLNDEQIAEIPVAYREYVSSKNNEMLQLIEANKNKTSFTETDIEKVAKEDVFPYIISKFRGKPILFDVWATWCAPCRAANETMKPMKKELEGRDIVYVYLAGEDSPLETWKNMIADLKGEHFRLTKVQHDYFKKTFSIEGVPTYFLIDRKGNIKEKFTGYPGNAKVKEILLKLLAE